MPCVCEPASIDGYEYSQWIGSLFGACAYSPMEKTAYIFGSISLVTWLVALLPQIVSIYKSKTGAGISRTFIMIWIFGGLCMFLGGRLTNTPLPISLLGLYIVMSNVVILCQIIYYSRVGPHRVKSVHDVGLPKMTTTATTTLSAAALVLTTGSCIYYGTSSLSPSSRVLLSLVNPNACDYRPESSLLVQYVGLIMAWVSGFMFFFSRVPQIYQNHKAKSVQGLSLSMMSLIMFGNMTLGLQLLLGNNQSLYDFLTKTTPFLIGSVGTVFWDFLILFQAVLYNKKARIPMSGSKC
uniref:Uncharacterized protein n=1 Tax=Spongospora subterranea TaxID=70186 RepID=A0A0H5R6N3_9EUKA|eukprot:CRZ09486.1 hypothetical protein [Spongospora subterranea]